MHIDVLTLFPEMLESFWGQSMMKRAAERGAVTFRCVNPRDFATDPHRTTDDKAYGGGPGMVMKPEPLFAALESIHRGEGSHVVHLTPQGVPFQQSRAETLSDCPHLIFLCGHYEGIDERVLETWVDEEISIGDYVLTNGALAAAVVIDATVRLLPGVLGGEGAAEADSFSCGILDHPHYTRPECFRGMEVPEVLLSGNHAAIAAWRKEQALVKTRRVRPDLLENPDTKNG